jgi:cytochrome c5
MSMAQLKHIIALFLVFAMLVVPGPSSADGNEPEAIDADIVSWRTRYLALGEDVFQWACARCHANPETAAPQMGVRDDWENRSPLWSAVLLEHAKQGFMEMPAKGGHPYLSDRAVQAAGEYMLGETFPELPVD